MNTSLVSRVRSRFTRDAEGNAVVEMAVMLPLVMLIMTGIFSFSAALYQKLQLAEAVSNAGHYLAVARGDADPCANAINYLHTAAPALNQSQMIITMTQNGAAMPTSCPSPSALTQGATAVVTVTYPTSLAIFRSQYSTFNLTSQIQEVIQ